MRERQLLDVVGTIYQAGAGIVPWEEALASVCALAGCAGINLMRFDLASRTVPYNVSHGISDEGNLEYNTVIVRDDPRGHFIAANLDRPHFCDYLHISEAEMARHPYYDWLRRTAGFRYYLAVPVQVTRGHVDLASLQWSPRQGHPQRADIDLFGLLAPHLRRATETSRRLSGVNLLDGAAAQALDRLSVGVLLLDGTGRPLSINRSAEAMLGSGDGLSLGPAGLCAARRYDDEALRRLLRDVMAGGGGRPAREAAPSVAVRRPSGRRPYLVVACPLPRRDGFFTGEPPRAVVLVTDPDRTPALRPGDLSRLYGLTPKEALLAVRLAEGLTPAQVAEQTGTTLNTVRSQIRDVLARTGAARQSDLVRIVLAGAQGLDLR